MELQEIWQDYGLEELERGMQTLFPKSEFSLMNLLEKIMAGDILGGLEYLFRGGIGDMTNQFAGVKNIFIWLLILGLVSALLNHFVGIFDRNQIADLSFYYIYLLFSAVLLKCFVQAAQTAETAIENIILFVKLLVPTYMLAVGVATGPTSAGAYSQLLVLIIFGVEHVLVGVVLPLIYCFVILSVVNCVWAEEKLALFMALVEKAVGWLLKAAMGVVTGVSVFQAIITPMVDSVKKTALQKTMSVIPGIGDVADGAVELVAGTAVVIKNSIGIVLLILLLLLCASPLIQLFLTAFLFKGAAAFMGIIGDRRITACANRTGDAGMLLFRTTGTAMLLFLITLAVVATSLGNV